MTPFDAATLVITADHIHSLATHPGDDIVLAWDHSAPGGELRAMTRREALDAGFEAPTNRATLNDWSREDSCWNEGRTDVTPAFAKEYAEVLTDWLRRTA